MPERLLAATFLQIFNEFQHFQERNNLQVICEVNSIPADALAANADRSSAGMLLSRDPIISHHHNYKAGVRFGREAFWRGR